MLLKTIKFIIYNPYFRLTLGLLVFTIGMIEAWDTFVKDIMDANLKLHHGVMLIGITQILDALPNIITGLDYVASHDQNKN